MSSDLAAIAQILEKAQARLESALADRDAARTSLDAALAALAEGRNADAERHIESALGMLGSRRSFFG